MAPDPGNEPFAGQKRLSAKNTSAVCGWLQGTAEVSFGHGLLVFSFMLAPVRQSPARSWASCRFPAVGMGLAVGQSWPGCGPGPCCGCAEGWLDPLNPMTSAATAAPHTTATTSAQSRLGRLRCG